MENIYVLGIGGATPVFIELAEDCGYNVAGLYHYNDDKTGKIEYGYEVLGSFDDLYSSHIEGKKFLLTQGDMRIRQSVTERIIQLGGCVPTLIHPSSKISKFAEISKLGVVIGSDCIVQADSVICSNAVLWDQALVCHQSIIGEYCFIGPKALVGAHVNVESFAFIGQDALLVSGKVGTVGSYSLVGAGSVVVKKLPSNVIAAGNPARVIKEKK